MSARMSTPLAEQIPTEHFDLGQCSSYWDYRDATGVVVMRVCRWEMPGGKKTIRPVVRVQGGWAWRAHAEPRPLYNLDRLVANPDLPVIVVEGEKTADAAQQLFPSHICTTWAGGADGNGKANWAPLAGRSIILVPDCDPPGRKAMEWIRTKLDWIGSCFPSRRTTVRIVDPSAIDASLPEGWDLADAVKEGRDVATWLIERKAEPELPKRQPMNWLDLAKKSPPVRKWRISHWLTSGPTLLAGRGGIGKTLIAQTIATALALGKRFLDDVHDAETVLFWACEDDHDELWRRQVAINKFFEVDMSDLSGKLIIEPRLGLDNTLFATSYGAPTWTPLRGELSAQLRDYGASVLFLDNIGQTFGGKENDRHHVTTFCNGLAGLGDESTSIVLMGHPAKANDSEFSGSTAWENAVRMRWLMGATLPEQEETEETDPNVRYLCKRKTNYTVKDWCKLAYKDGVFSPQSDHDGHFQGLYGSVNRGDGADQCILFALERFKETGIRTTDGRTSPDYLPKKMVEAKLAADYSKKELADSLMRLRMSGRVGEGVIGKYENRTVKRGLVGL